MSAIAGIRSFGPGRSHATVRIVERMSQLLRHRGPDDHGLYQDDPTRVVLAGRDLATGDAAHIPVADAAGEVWLVLDGTIDNARALRHALALDGQMLRTDAGAEVALAAYRQYGLDFLTQLEGVFALALWDRRSGQLMLARDRLGKKPLYYFRQDGLLAFASEIKALTGALPFRRRLDPAALAQYLGYGCVMPPLTLFEGVFKLAPGELMMVERDGNLRCQRWWKPCGDGRKAGSLRSLPLDQHIRNYRMLLESSVADRLGGDPAPGLLLSGSLASAAVGALASRLIGRSLDAVTIVDPAAGQTEDLRRARLSARAMRARHHEVAVGVGQLAEVLPDFVRHLDEPVSDPHGMLVWWAARHLRDNGLAAALAGDGGEVSLARGTTLVPAAPALGQRIVRAGGRLAAGLLASMGADRLAELFRSASEDKTVAFHDCHFLAGETTALLAAELRELTAPWPAEAVAGRVLREAPPWVSADRLALLSYSDLRLRLCERRLACLDKSSMAQSVQLRAPFLDHQLVDYVLAVPSALLLPDGGRLLQRAVADLAPDEVVAAPSRGDDAPAARWFTGDIGRLLEERVHRARLFQDGIVDPMFCLALLHEHRGGRGHHQQKLWNLLVLAEWYDLFWVEAPTAPQRAQAAE